MMEYDLWPNLMISRPDEMSDVSVVPAFTDLGVEKDGLGMTNRKHIVCLFDFVLMLLLFLL